MSVTPIFYANRSNWAQKEGKKDDNTHTPPPPSPPPPPPPLNELIARPPFW